MRQLIDCSCVLFTQSKADPCICQQKPHLLQQYSRISGAWSHKQSIHCSLSVQSQEGTQHPPSSSYQIQVGNDVTSAVSPLIGWGKDGVWRAIKSLVLELIKPYSLLCSTIHLSPSIHKGARNGIATIWQEIKDFPHTINSSPNHLCNVTIHFPHWQISSSQVVGVGTASDIKQVTLNSINDTCDALWIFFSNVTLPTMVGCFLH